MKKEILARKIIDLMGGSKNISHYWHCITRLRFNLVDDGKANLEEIKKLEGVLGAQFNGGQSQVILGAKVAEVYECVNELLEEQTVASASKKKQKPLDAIFDVFSGIFTPILPAIVGSGLIKGIMALFTAFGWMSAESSTYAVLNIFSDAAFYFLPFLIAMTAAKKFKVQQSLALTLAAILLYPTIVNGAAEGAEALKFFGLAVPLNSYTSSVIPIILGVLLLSYVYKLMNKIIPKSVTIVFTPLLSILITAPILLIFIAPLGNVLGGYLNLLFTKMFEVAGPLAGLLMGGLMPLIVITGMHYAFFPGTFASFEKFGYDIMLFPMNMAANIAQVGAVLGVLVRSKRAETRSLAVSAIVPAIFGITEPAIYGVTLRLKKPFYASMVGGAVGGCICGLFAVKCTAFSIPGITSVPTYIIPGTNNFIFFLIAYGMSCLTAFIVTLVLGFDEETALESPKKEMNIEESPAPAMPISGARSEAFEITSPITGRVVDLKDVADPTFAEEIIGKGVAVVPENGIVYAPFNGVVSMVTPTNHAIGVTSNDGVELLIHVGVDTVSMKGEPFELLVSQGQEITRGQELLKFDIKKIEAEHFDIIAPIVVTNSTNYLDIIHTSDETVIGGESKLLMCIN